MITDLEIVGYCKEHSSKESEFLKKVREDAFRFAPQADMCSDRLSGGFLRVLTAMNKPKHILELGLFYGYSTLCMCEGSPNSKITCLEWDGRVIEHAKDYIDKHFCKNEINIIHCNANKMLAEILSINKFDFIFIDADKRGYTDYVELCCNHLSSGGVLVLDNALWRKRVLSIEDDKDYSVDEANKIIFENDDVYNVLLPVRDGMHVAIKK